MDGVRPLIAVLGAMLVFGSCASFSERQTKAKFDTAVERLEHAYLRGDFMAANQLTGAGIRMDADRYENIKIVKVETTRLDISADKHDIVRYVELEYFRLDRNILQTVKYRERWHYNENERRWRLVEGVPDFGG